MKYSSSFLRRGLLLMIAVSLFLPFTNSLLAQGGSKRGALSAKSGQVASKRAMEIEDVVNFERITEQQISADGGAIAVVTSNWKGVSALSLFNDRGKELFKADDASSPRFDHKGETLFYRECNRGKAGSTLFAYTLSSGALKEFEGVKSYRAAKGGWDFLTLFKEDSSVVVVNLKSGEEREIATAVTAFGWSGSGEQLLLASGGVLSRFRGPNFVGEELFNSGGSGVSSEAEKNPEERDETIYRVVVDQEGKRVAFIVGTLLYLIEEGNIKGAGASSLAEGLKVRSLASGVSKFGRFKFSPNGQNLYFTLLKEWQLNNKMGVGSENKWQTAVGKNFEERVGSGAKVLEGERWPEVDIWSWKEKVSVPTQQLEVKGDRERGYNAVYNFDKGSYFALKNDHIETLLLIDEGDSQLMVGLSQSPYLLEFSWTNRPVYDVYIVDSYQERLHFALQGIDGTPQLSPGGKYIYWYSGPDSSWVAYSIASGKRRLLSPPNEIEVYDAIHNRPDWPHSFGAAGWSEGDSRFYLYDRYDIWSVDPEGIEGAVRVTENGAESAISYRYVAASEEEKFVTLDGEALLIGFDNESKGFGYYHFDGGSAGRKGNAGRKGGSAPKLLYGGAFKLSTPIKAAERDVWLFSEESFEKYPDLQLTKNRFKSSQAVTKFGEQQKQFLWGSAELISWTSLEGERIEGVLYKPENWEEGKSYPMIVNFYERNSHELHSYRMPEPHRSTVDYHWYNSNGYIIFNPDISYKVGFPGASAYSSVMPAVTKLIEEGIADRERVGAQGHSWGGYQVAYLATRTDAFAAIESGAPVVNMFSAYGGIRFLSGKNRSFVYERSQSRIGKTIWEGPQLYWENSPLFLMDKVKTPILIMHNDMDGHVPWSQGHEFFVALKRLQKPVWLLNYRGEVHWPQRIENKIDFQIRMKSFFDHYLNGAAAPRWMDPGLSIIELESELGYD